MVGLLWGGGGGKVAIATRQSFKLEEKVRQGKRRGSGSDGQIYGLLWSLRK